MTAQQPEYIITEGQLQRGHEVMSKTGRKKYEKEIRTRPHTPATERKTAYCPSCIGCGSEKDSSCDEPCPVWLEWHDAAIARTATLECRKIVGDKVIFNKCPFNGDCGQCFLCDNTGGCIISSDEEIRKLCNDSRSTATLAALDAFGKCIDAEMISAGDCQYSDEPVVTVAALAKIEESLRTAAQEDEQP
jgi:hypothetical protein